MITPYITQNHLVLVHTYRTLTYRKTYRSCETQPTMLNFLSHLALFQNYYRYIQNALISIDLSLLQFNKCEENFPRDELFGRARASYSRMSVLYIVTEFPRRNRAVVSTISTPTSAIHFGH